MRRWPMFAALLCLLALAAPARPALAHEICFADKSPHCLEEPFSDYWEDNGGLPVFGYPVSSAYYPRDTDDRYLTQWFERNRLEEHPENDGTPYRVLLGLLGKERLAQLGRDWAAEGREAGPKEGCLWFAETGHNVCNQLPASCWPVAGGPPACSPASGFRSYWEGHGLKIAGLDAYSRSLQLFGLPLTEPKMETNSSGDTVMTQWFERARFEWHPNNTADFSVLLGRLGTESLPAGAPQTELRQRWDQWRALKAADYDVVVEASCFCPPEYTSPVRIAVRGGVPGALTYVESGKPVADDQREWYARFDTVEKLFGLIDDAYVRKAARVTVSYDPARGYPTSVSIDYDERIADEELAVMVRSLELK
ncbi:MAG TPA: DUF6174 domain-containing protein [Herpetosiphonaceae bacterium]